jgi:ABC-2 type transport system ATP-binding protein
VQPWSERIAFSETEPTLEDVFIHLMKQAPDNSVVEG